MINLEHLELKQLTKNGVETLIDWARNEGWNPGLHDLDVFWETDPNGFYGFYFKEALIAGGAIVSYNQEFGFMGLFIVHPDFRGQGIGNKLWYLRRDLLIKRLHDGAPIGMDGVVDIQPFYAKGGFNIAFRDERYEVIGKKQLTSKAISSITTEDFNALLEYDMQCFGYKRNVFLKHWLSMPNSKSFKFQEVDTIKGFAVIRKAFKGFKIGPLFADTSTIAEALYKACLNTAIDEPVYIDIPVINEHATDLVKKFNADYIFECARMYYGKPPEAAINKVFGITSFELG